jgi:hypothetical protein
MTVELKIPQQQNAPLTPGASTPQQSALMKIENMNKEQTAINKIGGKKYKKYKKGGGSIAIPPTSTSSYDVNHIVKDVVSNDLRAQANGEFDNGAFKKGGSKKYRKNKKTKRKSIKKTRNNRTRYIRNRKNFS